jgi:tungstate transport system permease protein
LIPNKEWSSEPSMNDFAQSLASALSLIVNLDSELLGIVGLSLRVSLTASIAALLVGAPIGAWLAITSFPGRQVLVVLTNALLGLPPVVAGLAVYLLLSRSGPLGSAGLLFTPTAMIIAQTLLAAPIVVALVHRSSSLLWAEHGDLARIDGLSSARCIALLLALGRASLLTAFLAAFGRAIAEVGAIIMVGGNIRGFTRTMTTTIALETSKGELPLAFGLGLILLALSVAVSTVTFLLVGRIGKK